MAKKLLIFAGPNGSGKSTLYRKLQSKYASLANLPLINPDDIAKELFGSFLPDGTQKSNRQMLVAGKKALQQRKDLLAKNKSFGFDNTFSKFRLIASLRESGARKEKSVIVKDALPSWSSNVIATLIERMKS